MQEIHAVANGDGTYTAIITSIVNGRPTQYRAENVRIVTDNLVLDGQPDNPVMQFTFTNQFP